MLKPKAFLARAMLTAGVVVLAALALAHSTRPPLLSTAQASGPGAPPGGDIEQGAILVKFKPLVFSFAADLALGAQGFRTIGAIPATGARKIAVTPGGEEEAARALSLNPLVEYAEPNYRRSLDHTPNDPRYNNQWALQKIKAASAWDVTTGSPSIVVAVIDTGIDVGHPDRPQNLLLGADFIADPHGGALVSGDPQGHGTHVAGIVAARMNNGAGVAGVAPGVTIMSIRVLDAQGVGDTYTTARAITYAADNGAKIISLSLAGLNKSTAEEEAVNYASSRGVLVVAAAGNCYAGGANCDGQVNPINYPAALDHVVAAASTDVNDLHAWYSETGSYIDLAAPGSSILSTCINSNYCSKSGTSMATPYVSGVAALAWSVAPSLSPNEIESVLRQSAVDLGEPGRDDTFGHGRVDAYGAVSRAQQESSTPTPTPSASATPTRTRTATPAASPSPTSTASPSPTVVASPPATPAPVPTSGLTPTPTPTPSPPLLSAPLGPGPTPNPLLTPSPPLFSVPLGPGPGATPTPLRVFMPAMMRNLANW